MRVVSLTCSNTEIVAALGRTECLVGVDDHSDWPEAVVSRLPRVGKDLDIDLDAVERLEPDLVLASLTVPGHERIVEGLVQRGIPHLAPEPVSLADVYADIRLIGAALGAEERAEGVVAEMKAAMPPVHTHVRPSILVEWWPKPVIVPGRHSWVTDLIVLAGGTHPLQDEPVKSRAITADEALGVDASVIAWCGVPEDKYRPSVVLGRAGWQDVPAVVHGRVHPIAEAFLGRPGPRLVEGYRQLRSVIEALTP